MLSSECKFWNYINIAIRVVIFYYLTRFYISHFINCSINIYKYNLKMFILY